MITFLSSCQRIAVSVKSCICEDVPNSVIASVFVIQRLFVEHAFVPIVPNSVIVKSFSFVSSEKVNFTFIMLFKNSLQSKFVKNCLKIVANCTLTFNTKVIFFISFNFCYKCKRYLWRISKVYLLKMHLSMIFHVYFSFTMVLLFLMKN